MLLPLFVASGLSFFASLDMLNFLGLDSWRTAHNFYLVRVFALSAAVVGCHFGVDIVRRLLRRHKILIIRFFLTLSPQSCASRPQQYRQSPIEVKHADSSRVRCEPYGLKGIEIYVSIN
jgi:hypothetical protein